MQNSPNIKCIQRKRIRKSASLSTHNGNGTQWCAEVWWWPGRLLDCMPPTKF